MHKLNLLHFAVSADVHSPNTLERTHKTVYYPQFVAFFQVLNYLVAPQDKFDRPCFVNYLQLKDFVVGTCACHILL